MTKIKRLSDNVINLIAAGEVVEKPSSVIKELVENSIDAGASEIDIFIDRSGKNKIIILDNGFGMSKDDLLLAIERHTTSKLDENDIMNIQNFGFRGEALASIASVSRVKISSRAAGAADAYMIIKEDDGRIELLEDNIPRGTKIEISDLFFSTPARLKFLKSDNTELAACFDIIKKLAISHPDISFTVTSNDKLAFKYQAADQLERVGKVLPKDFVENSAEIDFAGDDLKIRGYVSIPTYHKASATEQYLFVNNRPVRDKLLIAAVKVAYKDFLEYGRHPLVVIFVEIDYQSVDVNVHPAKIEIRFQDPNLVRGVIIAAIKDALSKESHKTSTTISTKALGFFQAPKYERQEALFEETTPFIYQAFTSKKPFTESSSEEITSFKEAYATISHSALITEDVVEVKPEHSLGFAIAQFYNTYIISQTEDAIIIIDQHAAHERLVYEDLKIELEEYGIKRQRLLIPEVVEFHDSKFALKIYDKKAELLRLGLTIELDFDNVIKVIETPILLGKFDIKAIILDIADYLIEFDENFAMSNLIEHVTETYACHHSIRAGRKMNLHEMNALIRKMEETPFSGQCNHGRPTYLKLGKKDIEKLFGRR
jgi:DNA mismatch repair protein MutL